MNLTTLNAWWNSGGAADDIDLKRALNLGIKYFPVLFSAAELKDPNVYTIRGPRRAGKTTALKLLIHQLIQQGDFTPRSIVWSTADTCRTLRQLQDLLFQMLDNPAGEVPKLLVVDEVTSVSHWQKVIKNLRDTDIRAQSACWILTGSSAVDLGRGSERMPGRRRSLTSSVQSLDRVLLPMSFKDFAKALELPTAQALPLFLKYGGFPLLAASARTEQQHLFDVRVAEQRDAVLSEFERRKLDRSIVHEVIEALATQGVTATSWEAFGKQFSSASRDTVRMYVRFACESYLLAAYWSFDSGRGRVALKRDRKLLWIDPVLFQLSTSARAQEPAIVEGVVGSELLRRFEGSLFEGFYQPRNVYTWKSRAGKEIDFLVVSGKTRFPVEVKWQDQVSPWDLISMEQAFKSGVCVSKKDSPIGNCTRVLSAESFLIADELLLPS